jgi:GNAT superfamily N-acetyltransferase
MHVRTVLCQPGDWYFPWNYRRRDKSGGRVIRRRHDAGRGEHVVNALDDRGRIVGSAHLRVGARALKRMIKTEEFEYGGGNNSRGPYLWPDDHDALPWIVVLHGLWTRPDARRRGVARHLIEHIRGFELPLYVAFANPHMESWFERELHPDEDEFAPWQEAIDAWGYLTEEAAVQPFAAPRYQWAIELIADRSVGYGELYAERSYAEDPLTLSDLLFEPPRADWYDLDGGAGESDISDTAFAADRRYGYELAITEVQEEPLIRDIDWDLPDAHAALAEPVTLAAAGELTVTVPDVITEYATLRRLLRTGRSEDGITVADAVEELLIADVTAPIPAVQSWRVTLATATDPRDP